MPKQNTVTLEPVYVGALVFPRVRDEVALLAKHRMCSKADVIRAALNAYLHKHLAETLPTAAR